MRVFEFSRLKKAIDLLTGRFSRNVYFWLVFAFFHHYPFINGFAYAVIFFASVLTYGLPIYINNLWLIPRYLIKRKYLIYFSLLSLLIAIAAFENKLLGKWVAQFLPPGSGEMQSGPHFYYTIMQIILLFVLLAFGKFLTDAIRYEEKQEKLREYYLEAELEGLRSQVNPHFLFNALNTIYGMARRTDQATAGAILQLSDILRHTLYENDQQQTDIDAEVNLIRQYIRFQQLRLFNKDSISLHTDIRDQFGKIMPMLLLPFVENAFKHSLDLDADHSRVNIQISFYEGVLQFFCANSIGERVKENKNGIGVRNVKRRLQLCYPSRHELNISTTREFYSVQLKIRLS